MATIKSCTSVEQGLKLVEILQIESADMEYISLKKDNTAIGNVPFVKDDSEVENSAFDYVYNRIPCWSLASLLNVMPKGEGIDCSISFGYYNSKGEYIEKWLCAFEKEGESTDDYIIETIDGDNPVDACYEMILKLKELKLL